MDEFISLVVGFFVLEDKKGAILTVEGDVLRYRLGKVLDTGFLVEYGCILAEGAQLGLQDLLFGKNVS